MIRQIIHIDKEKCNGCGACASACHEGAIEMVNGKATLTRDDYCDGMGDCLPHCPTGAITFTEREAAAYDEKAVEQHKQNKNSGTAVNSGTSVNSSDAAHSNNNAERVFSGCPGHALRTFNRENQNFSTKSEEERAGNGKSFRVTSQLAQWPCQIRLVPVNAPYFNGAKLLIAADCTAYAYANMHGEFMRGKITIIGCPKLDDADYTEKLTEIIKNNDVKSLTVIRMEVPCCGGLERAAVTALKNSGKFIPWQVITVSVDGNIID